MNNTNIKTLNAHSMILENLSVENLVIELVPSYWVTVILVLTVSYMSLGSLMLFTKLISMYKKYKTRNKAENRYIQED
jgi:hypothetical protein